MRVFLDSRDLIALVEKRSARGCAYFEETLRNSAGQLVFSMHNIVECCAPLVLGDERSSVMRTLNRLEDMPHIYVAEARITALELQEAVSAFLEGREYRAIDLPVVPRFDYVVSASRDVPTKQYLKYPLAQIVFELWCTDKAVLVGYPEHGARYKEILTSDRAHRDYKEHEANFWNVVTRDLNLYRIAFPAEQVKALADWIWESPARCPAIRLGYTVFHKILRNVTDSGYESDIPDFAHLSCIPYCDAVTLDSRMRGYVVQTDHDMVTAYSQKVLRNLDEVEAILEQRAV